MTNDKCIYLNVRGLVNNFEDVKIMARNKKPWIIFASETHLTEDVDDYEVNIKGYKLNRCDSHSTRTGGVAIYVKNKVKFSIVNCEKFLNFIWTLSIDVIAENVSAVFTVIYHAPQDNKLFLDHFEQWCEYNINFERKNIICGDFNIDLRKSSTYSDRVIRIIQSLGMKQLVMAPTRITKDSRTLIDYVISKYR